MVLDLHDGPVQDIFAALSQLTSLRARISASEQPAEAAALARAITALESSLREIRGLLSTLRGPAFAGRELRELLAEAAVEHEALTGAAVGLDLGVAPAVPLRVKIGLYRILQEALSNVRRHDDAAFARGPPGQRVAVTGKLWFMQGSDAQRPLVQLAPVNPAVNVALQVSAPVNVPISR